MQFRQFILPFTLGITAGVVINKNWPKIREISRPVVRGLLKSGSGLIEKGREAYHEQSEKFSDLVAEIREEDEAKAKGETPPATDPAPKGQG